MANWISSVTLRLNDQFSSGWQKAANRVAKGKTMINEGAEGLKGKLGNMAVTRDLAITSMYIGRLNDTLQSWTDAPGKVASSFEDGMARVSTVLNETNAFGGDTAASMAMIEQAAADMAGGVSQSGKLAAIGTDVFTNSVYTMLSSGLSVEQGIAATEQASLLAKATGGNMADAASALTGIYNNLGDKSADAGTEFTRLSDIVAGTQNYFAFEGLGQFTDGLKNASGVAVANNIPFTQLSAVIGQLNSNMIVGAEAGTAVKSVVAQLGAASGRLGFEIAKTSDGGIDLVETFANIEATGADGQAMIAAFGTEAGPAVSLLTKNLDELRSGYDYVNDAAEITQENAAKMAETLTTKQENLNVAMQVWQGRLGAGANAVKGLGLEMKLFGVRLLNGITGLGGFGKVASGVFGGVIQLAGGFSGLASNALQASTGIASMMELWKGKKDVLMMARGGLKMVTGGLGKMVKGLFMGGKAVITFIPKAVAWMSTMWGVAAAHVAAHLPLYATIAAVAALAAGAVWVIRNFDKVKAWFGTAWTAIKGWFSAGFGFIKGLFTESPTWVQAALLAFMPLIAIPMQIITHWDTIKGWFAAFADWVVGIAQKISAPFEWIGDKIGGLFGRGGGEGISGTMAEGVAGDNTLYSATARSFNQVDRLIPHSDAQEGPFSRLTQAGRAIMDTMASGAREDADLGDAIRGSAARALAFGGAVSPAKPKDGNILGPVIQGSFPKLREGGGLSGLLGDLITQAAGGRPGRGKGDRPIHIRDSVFNLQFSEFADLNRFVQELREQVGDAV